MHGPTKLEMVLAVVQIQALNLDWTGDPVGSVRRALPIFLKLIHISDLSCTIDADNALVRFTGQFNGTPARRAIEFRAIEDFFVTRTTDGSDNATLEPVAT